MTLLRRLKDIIKALLMGPAASIERSQFIAEEALKDYVSRKVHLSSRSYHADNLTIEFLIEYLSESNPYRPKQADLSKGSA